MEASGNRSGWTTYEAGLIMILHICSGRFSNYTADVLKVLCHQMLRNYLIMFQHPPPPPPILKDSHSHINSSGKMKNCNFSNESTFKTNFQINSQEMNKYLDIMGVVGCCDGAG